MQANSAGVEKAVDFLVEQAGGEMLKEIKREARQVIEIAKGNTNLATRYLKEARSGLLKSDAKIWRDYQNIRGEIEAIRGIKTQLDMVADQRLRDGVIAFDYMIRKTLSALSPDDAAKVAASVVAAYFSSGHTERRSSPNDEQDEGDR